MRRHHLIARLLLSTAPTIVGTANLHAQGIAQETPDPKINTTPDTDTIEQIDDEKVLFEADSVSRDQEDGPIVAEGDVRAYFGERYLRADRLVYDPASDIVIAEGNVSITDENLDTVFAGRVELSGDLRDGISENFSALLEDNARLAADSAVREKNAKTRLSKAVYTACNVCNANGNGKTPTWRIKALRVTRDEERKVIRFRHAFLEIKGIPILYAPFIQAPDPSVERQSGFLTPRVGASNRLGLFTEIPYYFAISNHQDATFFPKYTAEDGVLWQAEWRRRGRKGYHVLSGGVIDFDDPENRDPNAPGVRWHYFGSGYHNFGKNWRAGYDLERVSDDTYLRRYSVRRRGDLRQELDRSSTNRLRSNVNIAWAEGGSKLNVDSFLFQGLRASDRSELTPYVLPLINFQHDFSQRVAGGHVSANANIAVLQRSSGADSRRLTTNAHWEREKITKNGHRINLFGELRGDAYFFEDLDEGTEILPGVPGDSTEFETRFSPTAGVEWSYPLTRKAVGARLFLEPRIQIVASPSNRNRASIINEDSQSIEFDYAGLFDFNKSTGFDKIEDGQRMNVGFSASAIWPNGIEVDAAIGEQFRLQDTDAFNPSAGLGESRSDIVGSLNVNFNNRVGIENRFRINKDSGDIQRAESVAFLRAWRLNSNVSYVRLNEENTAAALVRREELNTNFGFRLTRHWSSNFGWRADLVGNQTITQNFGIDYHDECSSFGITLRRDRTRDVGLQTNNAILIRFTLKTLVDSPLASPSI